MKCQVKNVVWSILEKVTQNDAQVEKISIQMSRVKYVNVHRTS